MHVSASSLATSASATYHSLVCHSEILCMKDSYDTYIIEYLRNCRSVAPFWFATVKLVPSSLDLGDRMTLPVYKPTTTCNPLVYVSSVCPRLLNIEADSRTRRLVLTPLLKPIARTLACPKGKQPTPLNPHNATQSQAGLDKNKGRGGKSSSQMDAASLNSVPKAPGARKGNPEQVGFADQVGSAGGSENPNAGARGSKKNGSEGAASPGFLIL